MKTFIITSKAIKFLQKNITLSGVIAAKADADTALSVMIKRRILLLNQQRNNCIMKKYLFLLLAAATLSLSSCSPFQVRSDYAETANFNSYKTYKLRIDHLKLNDIDKDRVLNEVSKQLQMRGLTVADSPDLIVSVKANHKKIKDVQRSSPYGMYGWGGPFGWGVGMSRTWSSNYNEGALMIDLIDAKTNKLVWQGIGSGISVDSPRAKQKQIPEIVAEIMKNYPPKK